MAVKVHFMGIGGSGMSGVAQIAKAYGYQVSGCDQAADTPYITQVKAAGIPVSQGHDANHITTSDLVTVSPAIFYQNNSHPETQLASQQHKLLTWQQFLGKYLHQDKFVICVAGTHGKSTTTALVGQLLSTANLDSTVEVGATVKDWQNNIRIGQGKYFVSEADEFNDNFLAYHPDIIILNNIEFDHPEYFHTFENMLLSYAKFVSQLKPNGILLYNSDDPGIQKLLTLLKTQHQLPKLIEFSHSQYSFTRFPLKIPGQHNQTNAAAVIKLGQTLNISENTIAQALSNFTGLSRRLDLIGEPHGIKVFDDYANLPTAFKLNIETLKSQYPTSRLWVIIEPHTFSRLKAVLPQLTDSVAQADQVIISQIYASREVDPGNFSGADIATAIGPKALYIPEFSEIISYLKKHIAEINLILIMGSGNSHHLSQDIVSQI